MTEPLLTLTKAECVRSVSVLCDCGCLQSSLNFRVHTAWAAGVSAGRQAICKTSGEEERMGFKV